MHFSFPRRPLIGICVFVLLLASISGFDLLPPFQEQKPLQLHQFDFITETSGWILLDRHLFWTSDAGHDWNEIGPTVPSNASIQDVEFIDPGTGWILWTVTNSDEGGWNFQLANTIDGGGTWTIHSLPLFELGDIASYAEKVQMNWFDLQTGWISVKQMSGSNFSVGTLFTTLDAGVTWRRYNLPIADKIYFNDPLNGWAIGGPAGNQIFRTIDGGASWNSVSPATSAEEFPARVYLPLAFAGQGLFVATSVGEENKLSVYSLEKNPDAWSLVGQVRLDSQPGIIGLSILDVQNFLATIPGTATIVRMENGELDVRENKDNLSASIVELDMISLDNGWAKSVVSDCAAASLSDRESASISCSSTTGLLRTHNGGITWEMISFPIIYSDATSPIAPAMVDPATSAISVSENTVVFTGQGFDRCEIPTLSQMQTWWNSSPYKTVNLYIGGSNRACGNNALISSYLFQLFQQGWKFFPTWVGPQAPCTGYASRITSDVNIAYTQGVDEANLAVDRLAELGLVGPNKTGSVVYYDIEQYGTNTTCRGAVNAFMNGWVSQIHARGNIAGVYGSTLCNTGLSDFLNITNVPDVIWPARWYHNLGSGYYDPNASVWNLGSCIPNTAWANHQRIRQYEGDHNETWGNLTLDIDSNALDGVVAIPYDYPFVGSSMRRDPNPTNASSVRFTVVFSKSVTGVNKSDFILTAAGVTNASILSVSGSGTTYTVAVNTGTGNGNIRLDVVDNDSILDGASNPLGGLGTGNGNFNSGEEYTVLKGFQVSGRDLLDVNGNSFVMRGINHPHNWYPDQTNSFADIKATGANTVRVVLSSGKLWPKNSAADVANVINLCKTNKLICVLEVHDTTGYGEDSGAASLAEAISYWKEIKSVLIGQEAYVIINIGNEPYGNLNAANWVNDTENAIVEMRNAGFQHMLMVDAPNWGQDWQYIMRDNAANILASDSAGNTVFSIHMYGVFETAADIQSYVSTFINAGLPLVIGEFGWNHSDGDPDEDAIMAIAETNGIGYLGWMWSGGGYLDMVTDFDPAQMTSWGTRIIGGANGIVQTSCEASVYGSGPNPKICSVTRANSNPTEAASISFAVKFSESVTGVDSGDFVLTTTGVTSAAITGVSGSDTAYTITVNTGSGSGTIRLDVLDDDSIKDASDHPLGGNGNGNGSYTSGQTYTISKYTFTDVPDTYWAWSYIERLYDAGITSGCSASPLMYCPTATVTRDQMAVFLLKGKHTSSYVPPAATGVFQDVPTDYWAASWIEQLAAEGITSGCSVSPEQYCPTTPVTRDQMAVFLLKAKYGSGYAPPAATGVFQDVPTNYWAASWIEQLAAEGITSGCSVTPKLYCPTTPVTRDQMAVFLVKNFNLP